MHQFPTCEDGSIDGALGAQLGTHGANHVALGWQPRPGCLGALDHPSTHGCPSRGALGARPSAQGPPNWAAMASTGLAPNQHPNTTSSTITLMGVFKVEIGVQEYTKTDPNITILNATTKQIGIP